MALLFIDGFDIGDTLLKWDSVSGSPSASTTTRFSTGRSLNLPSSAQIFKSVTPSTQITMGFAILVGSGNNLDIRFYGDSGGTPHVSLSRNSNNGILELRRGSNGGTLLASGTTPLLSGLWYYIEMQSTIADAGGVATVRLNGNTSAELTYTGDTKNGGTNTTIDTVMLLGTVNTQIDDLYILNSTGATNTTFLGDIRVHSLLPSGDGATSQLTGSDGNQVNNYQQVDEAPYSTADYNASSTVGHRDTYALNDLPAGTGTIYGLQNTIVAAKSDAGAISARTVLRTANTNYYGTTRPLGASYITYKDIHETNPNTSTAWNTSSVNGLEAGVEVA